MTPIPFNRENERQSSRSGEAGFTLIEMIIVIVLSSILGTFIFGVLTKSLTAQRNMQVRKERSDDAVLVLERISREVREANSINSVGSNKIIFKRADTGKAVKFIRNTSTNRLRRQSAADVPSLPGNSSSGNIVAENVTYFESYSLAVGGSNPRVWIKLQFSDGSDWETKIYPRSFGL